jgi:phenylalanyl-tRNA synthetase beta chain
MLEIDCEALLGLVSLEKYFSEPARYPSVSRDISIVVDNNVSNDNIISSITASAGELLKKVRLIDRYHGGQIPDGKTSLTYRLEYQDISRTLEDKEVQDAHSRAVRALQENLGASLR